MQDLSSPVQRVHARPVSFLPARLHAGGLGATRAGRRRVRDARMADYRRFAAEQDWQVLGMYQDLSSRYPVSPLIGAISAQSELAVTGPWRRWSGLAASVLVRSGGSGRRRGCTDGVVQLTTLDTGPLALQFTATWTAGLPDVVPLGKAEPQALLRVQQQLTVAARSGSLRPGDHVASIELELVHTRMLTQRGRVDLPGPLALLADLATHLD